MYVGSAFDGRLGPPCFPSQLHDLMGYSHGFYRIETFPPVPFSRFAKSAGRIIKAAEAEGIRIAGWDGYGAPTVTARDVRFKRVGVPA